MIYLDYQATTPLAPEARAAITHHPRMLNTEPLHLLFRKNDTQANRLREVFNAGLRRLAESGELERLQQLNQRLGDDRCGCKPPYFFRQCQGQRKNHQRVTCGGTESNRSRRRGGQFISF